MLTSFDHQPQQFYANSYADLCNNNNDNNNNNNNNKNSSSSSSPADNEGHNIPKSTSPFDNDTQRTTSLKHKTSLLFKKSNFTKEGLNLDGLSDRFRIKSQQPSSNVRVQISGPQNFKHLYHMDTSSNDPELINSHTNSGSDDTNSQQYQDNGPQGYKPSPSSMTSSLFSDDYFNNNQYPGTPSSPISSSTPNLLNDSKVSEKLSFNNINKKNSTSTMRTSITNSMSSVFDKTTSKRSEGLRSSSFSSNTGNSDAQKYTVNTTIPEYSRKNSVSSQLSHEPESLLDNGNIKFYNPFGSEDQLKNNRNAQELVTPAIAASERSRSRQNSSASLLSQSSSLSTASKRLLASDIKLETSGHILRRNKFLNESTPAPRLTPPALPASPAHTSHSEESTQTLQYDQLLKEDCLSPISNTATYVTPKLCDIISATNTAENSTASISNPKDLFQRPQLLSSSSLKNVKKSKSLKNLKKSFGKHLQVVGFSKFKNSNDSSISIGSDKSLTGFSPDIETNNNSGRPLSVDTKNLSLQNTASDASASQSVAEHPSTEILKHFSFEQAALQNNLAKNSFDIDFDKEVEDTSNTNNEKRNSGNSDSSNSSQTQSQSVVKHRQRHDTLVSKQSAKSVASNFSAFSFNTTKPVLPNEASNVAAIDTKTSVVDKRRSSVYIRQSWLKDEALAIFKNADFNNEADISVDSNGDASEKSPRKLKKFQEKNVIDEEDEVMPLAPNAVRKQALTNLSHLNNSYDNLIIGKTAFGNLQDRRTHMNQSSLSNSFADVQQEIESELEQAMRYEQEYGINNENDDNDDNVAFLLRRRSENDIANIAMLEVEPMDDNVKEPDVEKAEAAEEVSIKKSAKLNINGFKNIKRLSLHTPHYLLEKQALQSPVTSNFMNHDNASFASSGNNTIFLATPTKKFGHGKSLSIASSVYSNGAGGGGGDGHSRSSSLYHHEAIQASVEDISSFKPKNDVNTAFVAEAAEGTGNINAPEVIVSGNIPTKKKLSVDRNSYIQFNFNRFEDFKLPLNGVEE